MTTKPEDKTWWITSFEVDRVAEEPLSAWIEEQFGQSAVTLERPGFDRLWVEVYCEETAAAEAIRDAGQDHPGVHAARVRACPPREWSRFWRHHFTAQPLGKSLLLVPAWEKDDLPAEAADRHVILLEPGLSFGTGDHFTTRFCLENLEAVPESGRGAMLDAGSGSGVLSLAAVRLGFTPVLAMDYDPACREQGEANAQLNGLQDAVSFCKGDVLAGWDPQRSFEVVVANILSSILIQAADRLASWCSGRLILSGIRDPETEEVAQAFMARGFKEVIRDGDGEWSGLVMVKTG